MTSKVTLTFDIDANKEDISDEVMNKIAKMLVELPDKIVEMSGEVFKVTNVYQSIVPYGEFFSNEGEGSNVKIVNLFAVVYKNEVICATPSKEIAVVSLESTKASIKQLGTEKDYDMDAFKICEITAFYAKE